MLNIPVLSIQSQSGERNIYVSPFLLQSKDIPEIKSGITKISKLYVYDELKDEEYKSGLKQTDINLGDKFNEHVINYGQDFEKYYLGSLNVDFDSKKFWNWESGVRVLSEQDLIMLAELMFDPHTPERYVTIFTPTRPSDFNFRMI